MFSEVIEKLTIIQSSLKLYMPGSSNFLQGMQVCGQWMTVCSFIDLVLWI